MNAYGRLLAPILVVALAGCGSGGASNTTDGSQEATDATVPSSGAPSDPSPRPAIQDVWDLPEFAPLEPGTYFIDPDADPSTPLRVEYEIPAEGWLQWFGGVREVAEGHVAVSITTVTNVVRHGCRDHAEADPPVGPTVDDLATALVDLAPFRVTSQPTDVTIDGYRGKHLGLTVPDLPMEDGGGFTGCLDGNLQSWISPPNAGAFYGYTGPGYTEEFWILDVEGTRLVIVAHGSPGLPRQDLAEQRAILDSIRIEP